MSLKSRTFACPDCDGQFTILLDDRDPLPSHCTLCGAYVGAEPQVIPRFSRVGKATDGGLDKVYRSMEATSQARAEEAARMMGTSVAEQSNIKVTNMNDRPYEGESSFIAPAPTPVQVSATPPTNIAALQGQAGLATAAMIRQNGGSVGHKTLDGFKQGHHQRAVQMQRAGQMGAFSGK